MKLDLKAVALVLLLHIPMHEFGHFMIANVCGVTAVVRFNSVTVNEYDFLTIGHLIFFKLGGFLITMTTGIFFLYLLRNTTSWIYPALWVIASPGVSAYDFFDIGRILGSYFLAHLYRMIGYVSTVVGLYFLMKSERRKVRE